MEFPWADSELGMRLLDRRRLGSAPDLAREEHGEHGAEKVVGGGHERDLSAFGLSLSNSFEVLAEPRIATDALPGCLDDVVTYGRRTVLGDMAQTVH